MQITSLLASALVSACAMPAVLRYAKKKRLYDSLGSRKIHSGLVPRLGGVGIFLAFLAGLLSGGKRLALVDARHIWLLLGASLIYAAGLVDDIRGMRARVKLGFQIAAAALVVGGGFRFSSFLYAPDILSSYNPWLAALLTLAWIVGVANAINLIDGLDGLAGGISCIAALAYALLYSLEGQWLPALVGFSIAGATVGFLFFNFPAPKAKLFMGDSGSLFLGFSLAVLPLLRTPDAPGSGGVGVLPAVLILSIPIFDTLRAMYRRVKAKVSITEPDRLHFHHLLFDSGIPPRGILKIAYSVTACLAILFLAASRTPARLSLAILALGFVLAASTFKYAESKQFRRRKSCPTPSSISSRQSTAPRKKPTRPPSASWRARPGSP
ncbi:MAG: MraY family glycosyltransferase [Spirochaetota bacterium]